MKKILSLVALATALLFNGCSSTSGPVAGYEGPKEVSTYFKAPLMATEDVKKALEANGFEIVSTSKVTKAKLEVVVFTNSYLKTLASKPGRGFLAGAMRVLVNTKDKEISITNPRYFMRAFLQDDYKLNDEKPVLESIHAAFSGLTPSADKWEFDGLPTYQFMIGRPYYQDQIIAAEAAEGADAAAKAEANTAFKAKLEKKAKKNLIFKLEVADGITLYGVNLSKRTMKFADKIGVNNAGLLPWMILVEDGQAKALRADYYIAMTYPLLDLMGFASIMTSPGAVEKDVKRLLH